jgi:hypothetical protein
MNRLTDLEINCSVRKVLVRHWLDLGKISLRTTSGVTYLSGELARLPKVETPLTSSSVTEIINEIRRVSSVRRIHASFHNWVECDRVWKQTLGKPTDFQAELAKQKAQSVYDLTDFENQKPSGS